MQKDKLLYLSSIYSKYKPKKAIRNTMIQAMKDLKINFEDTEEKPLKTLSKQNVKHTREFLEGNLEDFMKYILSVTFADILSWRDVDDK
jgi:hypothetical protein